MATNQVKIQFNCSNCQASYLASIDQAGKEGVCKKCGAKIVVPKLEVSQPQKKRRRYSKRIIVAAITLLVVVLTTAILYLQYTKSPKYSLAKAKKAFEQHDLVSFEKYVDIESVTNSLIDQMLKRTTTEEGPKGEWEQFGESIGKGLITLFRPQLSKLASQQISRLVETGKFEEEPGSAEPNKSDFSLSYIWRKTGGKKTGFQDIEYIKREGKIAYVGLRFFQKQYNTDLILDLKMRDKGGYWQVAELSNFADYLRKIDELETKRFNELNAPIIETMEKILVIDEIQKINRIGDWGIDKKVVFSLKVRNNGEKEIDRYKLLLTCNSLDGTELKNLNIVDDDHIPPGKTGGGSWAADVNMFSTDDNLLFDSPQTKLRIKVHIQFIEFTDGTTLELHKKGAYQFASPDSANER